MKKLRRRNGVDKDRVLTTFIRTASYQKTAKIHRITRQRVFQIVAGKALLRRVAVPLKNLA